MGLVNSEGSGVLVHYCLAGEGMSEYDSAAFLSSVLVIDKVSWAMSRYLRARCLFPRSASVSPSSHFSRLIAFSFHQVS